MCCVEKCKNKNVFKYISILFWNQFRYTWSSFLACEQLVAEELDAVGSEAQKIEPWQNPQALISDAARMWHTFGADWDKASRMSQADQRKFQMKKMQEKLRQKQLEEAQISGKKV